MATIKQEAMRALLVLLATANAGNAGWDGRPEANELDVARLARRADVVEALWSVGTSRGSSSALGSGAKMVIDGICHGDTLVMRSGFTNQLFKMATLLEECCEAMAKADIGVVLLPGLAPSAQHGALKAKAVPVGAVLDVAALSISAWEAWPGCIVTDNATLHYSISTSPQHAMLLSASVHIVHQPKVPRMKQYSNIIDSIFKGIRPAIALKQAAARCAKEMSEHVGLDYIVVHMRCEADWYVAVLVCTQFSLHCPRVAPRLMCH